MAVLVDSDRMLAARAYVQKWHVELNNPGNVNLDDIKAAVDAADSWADANATAFNTALPNPFKTTASLQQKTALLAWVILKRAGII